MKKQKHDIASPVSFCKRAGMILLFLFIFFSHDLLAQNLVYVGGTLQGNRFWSNDSIYVVFQDLRIADSASLTIEPGALVKVVQGRGITVNGILRAGNPDNTIDTVRFSANSQKGIAAWRWKGIVFQNCTYNDSSYVFYAEIKDAETAIELNGCNGIEISGCKITGNQNSGIAIFNSVRCKISNCDITGNYTGIEMNASLLHKASDNIIENNFLQNENYNIYMYRQMGGIMNNNVVSYNLLQNSNNGLWIDNEGDAGVEKNDVEKNIFINNGGNAGYAVFISNDSTNVIDNIFWKNNIAVFCEQNITDVNIIGNSFYQNHTGIILGRQSFGYSIHQNTFSSQLFRTVIFRELTQNQFTFNNIICIDTLFRQIENETNEDGSVSNNFWNTGSDSIIKQLIWDNNDNPALGKLEYLPFLADPDTNAPPAPPLNAKKQWVNDKVRVSWKKGKEKDLKGYRLYYGDFRHYHFDNMQLAGKDTVYTIDNIDFNETIAVTTVDNNDTVAVPMLAAHESPYAMAEAFPYAGGEKIICRFHNSVTLSNSTVPYSYQQIIWRTNGDGQFNDSTILHPVYYPGQNDIDGGKVMLTIRVLGSDDTLHSDSFMLYIYDDPVSVAGSDKVISENDTLFLSEAVAENYQHVQWITSGDGYFGNDSVVNTYYVPGTEDKINGQVTLSFFVYSLCGYAVDTLSVSLLPEYSLEGSVRLNNSDFGNAVILAVDPGDSAFRSENIAYSQPDGRFFYPGLLEGNYYLYAVPDTALREAFPTYYAENLFWQQAYLLPFNAITKDVDIQMIPDNILLPEGEGSISGHFDFPAGSKRFSSYFYKWFASSGEKISSKNGLPNVTVLLLSPNKGHPLKYTLTDQNGDFSFNRLPYGRFLLKVEIPGCSVQSQYISITPQNKTVSGIIITLSGKNISITNNKKNTDTDNIILYPIPAKDNLTVYWGPDVESGTYYYYIFNTQGVEMLSGKMKVTVNQKTNRISELNELSPGIYFIHIFGNKTNKSFSLVIK